MTKTNGVSILLAAMIGAGSSAVLAAPQTPAASRPAPTPAPAARTPTDGSAPAPVLSQDAAARARMHECGHQWSSMKKAGTAGILTWKEFSATCLVVTR